MGAGKAQHRKLVTSTLHETTCSKFVSEAGSKTSNAKIAQKSSAHPCYNMAPTFSTILLP